MHRRVTAVLSAALLAGTCTGLALPAAADPTDGSRALDLESFGDLVAGSSHDRVFVSAGRAGDRIVVTDSEGTAIKTLADQPGANGMALSEDGSTLYTALSTADAVSAVDTSTLEEVARYDTGEGTCPGHVAVSSDRIWFTSGCPDGTRDYGLGAIDLSGSTPEVRTDLVSGLPAHPLVSVSSATSSRLALALPGSWGRVTTYDVSSDPPTEVASADVGDLSDMAVTADAFTVVLSTHGGHGHHERSFSDLALGESYDVPGAPAAAAETDDGFFLALGSESGVDGTDVTVFYRRGTKVVRRYDLDPDTTEDQQLVRRSLDFSADGSRLYAVSSDSDDVLRLHLLHDPNLFQTELTADTTRAEAGTAVTVSGDLTVTGDPDEEQYAPLTVTRTDDDGTTALPDVQANRAGEYELTDDSAEPGRVTYTVAYAGTERHAKATATASTVAGAAKPWDMDADGDAELLAGANRENIGSTRQAGMAMVLNGDPAGLTEDGGRAFSQKADGIPGAPEAYDLFGTATASGDFDNDGYADAVVSAPAEGLRGSANVGLVSVTPGSANGLVMSESRPLSPVHLDRVVPGTHFGEGLAVGDFDDDGFDDLAVGAPGEDWAVVYPGSTNGLVRSAGRVWTQETHGVPGRAADEPYIDRFGFAVAAGDANGDGFDDLAIGAPWDAEDRGYASGSVTMLYGSADGITASGAQRWSRDSNGIKNRPRRFGSGKDNSDDLGIQVTLADHDGDGFADLAAGAPGTPRWVDGDRRRDAGSVSVLFGSADGITSRDRTIAQDKPGIPGKPGEEDQLGLTLASGETSGDGAAELAVAAVREGSVTLLPGSSDTFARDGVTRYDQDTPGVPGKDEDGDAFGASLRLTDHDGDGHDDLAVGAPRENRRRGAVTVLYTDGGPGLTTTSTWLSQATDGVPGKAEAWDHFGTFY